MTEQLKPCQCGGKPLFHRQRAHLIMNELGVCGREHWSKHAVECTECYLSTDFYSSREEAIAAWNTRPEEDRLRAQLTRKDEVIAAQKEVIEALERMNTIPDAHGYYSDAFVRASALVNSARAKLEELEKA